MLDTDHAADIRRQPAARRALARGILWIAVYWLFLAACIYLPASLAWTRGWVFLSVYLALIIVSLIYLWRINPEIVVARSSYRVPARWWDVIIFAILFLSFIVMFPIAAFDDGRFHWSNVPLWLTVVGYILFLIGMLASIWVLAVNKFAEPLSASSPSATTGSSTPVPMPSFATLSTPPPSSSVWASRWPWAPTGRLFPPASPSWRFSSARRPKIVCSTSSSMVTKIMPYALATASSRASGRNVCVFEAGSRKNAAHRSAAERAHVVARFAS
jgi:hypothetical protein